MEKWWSWMVRDWKLHGLQDWELVNILSFRDTVGTVGMLYPVHVGCQTGVLWACLWTSCMGLNLPVWLSQVVGVFVERKNQSVMKCYWLGLLLSYAVLTDESILRYLNICPWSRLRRCDESPYTVQWLGLSEKLCAFPQSLLSFMPWNRFEWLKVSHIIVHHGACYCWDPQHEWKDNDKTSNIEQISVYLQDRNLTKNRTTMLLQ